MPLQDHCNWMSVVMHTNRHILYVYGVCVCVCVYVCLCVGMWGKKQIAPTSSPDVWASWLTLSLPPPHTANLVHFHLCPPSHTSLTHIHTPQGSHNRTGLALGGGGGGGGVDGFQESHSSPSLPSYPSLIFQFSQPVWKVWVSVSYGKQYF